MILKKKQIVEKNGLSNVNLVSMLKNIIFPWFLRKIDKNAIFDHSISARTTLITKPKKYCFYLQKNINF